MGEQEENKVVVLVSSFATAFAGLELKINSLYLLNFYKLVFFSFIPSHAAVDSRNPVVQYVFCVTRE